METSAIILMLIALVLVWGGLITAIVHLSRHPDPE
ncbi:methionine/alanine import family NSS transporter small subunit [Nesterenkonia halophila]